MSNVRYEITDHRNNGFYNYTKYKDGAVVKEGWGLYSHITLEEEKPLWIEAVNKYNEDNGIITRRVKLHNAIEDAKAAVEVKKKQFPENDPLIMPSFTVLLEAIMGGAVCNDDLINNILKLNESSLPTPKNIFRYTVNTAWSNAKNELNKAIYGFAEMGVAAFVMPVLELADNIIDTAFGTIDAIATEISLIYSDIIYYYKMFSSIKVKLSDEEKAYYKEKFNERIGQVGNQIKEYIYALICLDEFIQLFEAFKNLDDTAADVWNGLVKRLKSLKDLKLNETESTTLKIIGNFILALIPLLGAMIGALLSAKCSTKELANTEATYIEEAKRVFPEADSEADNDTNDSGNKRYGNTVAPAEIYDKPTCYDNAEADERGFTLNITNSNNSENDSNKKITIADIPEINDPNANPIDVLCKLSMCDPFEGTDIESLGSESGEVGGVDLGTAISTKFIIEVPKNMVLLPQAGQKFNANDIIGYDKNIPLKSTFCGIVEEKYEDYIFGSYAINEELFVEDQKKVDEYITGLVEGAGSSMPEYDELVNTLNLSAQTEKFITDIMPYIKFPQLALHTREHAEGNAVSLPIMKFNEKYEEEAELIIDDYHNSVQKLCDKDNISYYAKQDDIFTLKKQLDDKKEYSLGKLITLWNTNPGNMKYCSDGKISDFMLYDLYIDFLTAEHYIYDDDNPYVKELNEAISRFVASRTRLELNADNIDGLLEKFNEYADDVLKSHWKYKDISYYDKLSELFIYDYYKTDSLVEADSTDENKDSVYKKVLDYLKAIVGYTPQADNNIDVNLDDEHFDINKLLEEQSKIDPNTSYDKEKLKLEQKLKRISHMYVSLRKIEMGVTDTKTAPFITNKALAAFNKLRESKGDIVYDYYRGKKYTYLSTLYGKEKTLEEFLKALEKQTKQETEEILRIAVSAISWYQENYKMIISGEIFDKLKMILLPEPGTIYRYRPEYDYYEDKSLVQIIDEDELDSHFRKIDYYLVKPYDDTGDKLRNDLSTSQNKQLGRPTRPEVLDEDGNPYRNMSVYPDTTYDVTTYMYWLRYCCMATLVNCMIPLYWATGILLPTPPPTPILLPIIYIPFVVIPAGKVTIVIGLGLCGIMPQPMILFVNQSAIDSTMIVPITLIFDMIIKMLEKFKGMQFGTIEIALKPMISALDKDIRDTDDAIQDIDYQISMLKLTEIDKNTLKALKQRAKDDFTSHNADKTKI